ELTDSGHWNLAQIRYDGRMEQRYFNLENPQTRIELRRSWTSYFRLALRFLRLAIASVLAKLEVAGFLASLVLIAKSFRAFWEPSTAFLLAQFVGLMIAGQAESLLSARFLSSARS